MTWARKNFVEKVWEWKEKSGNTITTQMRRMGDSVDWSREYFTMDDKLSKVGHRDLRAAVRAGPDLPRQAPGELGPGAADRRVATWKWRARRKTARSGTSPTRWPMAQRLADRGHHPPRDHAGRRGRDGAPRGRALPAPDRPDGEAAAVRPPDPGDCRRLRGQGVRHRRGQGHARARPERLRRRPAPPAADDRRADAGRHDQRQRARQIPRPGPLRGPQGGGRRPRSAGPAGRDQEAQADGAALRPHRPGGRAHADRPVVRRHEQGQRQDPTGKSIAQKAIDAVDSRRSDASCPRTGSTPTTSG